MATVKRSASRRSTILGTLGVVLVAVAVFLVVRPAQTARVSTATDRAVSITSTARHRFTNLEALLAASDIVISGRVIAIERGRVVGDVDAEGVAGGAAIRSRLVTVAVGEIIAGGVASGDPDLPGFTVVNSQGRYLLSDPADTSVGTLRGGDRRDPLVRRLAALGIDGLAARIRSAAMCTTSGGAFHAPHDEQPGEHT